MDARLAAYSVSHLVVDFACLFVIMGSFSSAAVGAAMGVGVLIYNFVGFALQVPMGYAADALRIRPFALAMVGSCLVAVGVATPGLPWVALVVCGLGNAVFHLGGGIDSLVGARGRYYRPGVFIAFGALGVALGNFAGARAWLPGWAVVALLVVCLSLQWLVREALPFHGRTAFRLGATPIRRPDVVILVLMSVVVVRAMAGLLVNTPWKSGVALTIVAATCVFAGKFAGGFLADRFGARNVAVVSLVVSLPLLTLGAGNVAAAGLGLFCFNIMTAVTLVGIAAKLPDNPGFAFGLTTLALFVGATVPMLIAMAPSVRLWLLAGLLVVAVACIVLSTSNRKEVAL